MFIYKELIIIIYYKRNEKPKSTNPRDNIRQYTNKHITKYKTILLVIKTIINNLGKMALVCI